MKSGRVQTWVMLVVLGLISCGPDQAIVKGDTQRGADDSAQSSSAVTKPASAEVTSLAGRWKLNNKNERAIWFFDTTGRCAIRPSGLVEQKGRYQYDGKHLVINFDSGTTRYTVLEKKEPNLVIMMRWGDLYNITNVLTRIP